jgi:hypothetical protein
MSGECRKYSLEHGGDDSVRAHMEKESIEGNGDVLDNIDWLRGAQSSPQFTHVYARQSLERLMQLPPSMSRIALKIADGASLVEASKEMSLDILDGMKLVKSGREVMQWSAEMDADERKGNTVTISPHAQRRAWERFKISISHADAQTISEQIALGLATKIDDDDSAENIHWSVAIHGKFVPLVFNHQRKHIVTVLPECSLTSHDGKSNG